MPIQGGELNYNKNENKKAADDKSKDETNKAAEANKAADSKKPSDDKPKTEGNKPAEASKPSDDKSKAADSKPMDGKKPAREDTPKPSISSSTEKKADSLPPKTEPTKPAAEKLESSKLSDASKSMDKTSSAPKPGAAGVSDASKADAPSVPPKPMTMGPAPMGNGRPADAKNPAPAVNKSSMQPSNPGAGSKETGAAALSSSGKPAESSQNSNLNKNNTQLPQEDDEPNAIVKFFRKIKNAITGFCCQTEDSLRHVA
ncbi:hypothetical protein NEMIN01_0136 [Nematocida minor]|uniref:uncharacterized protein n=1 Tax=Nematocida minor TaxID=1912983 RepID=UPI00221E9870|nr:uncharacterized protein NEMIN01_0032 [Nematocida minor]XP_051332038.1 uncharacterized protein NEMIN01_0136 [Nematocida minor]KAI5188768.1 hypothetical protein NEMIN01_0032 [Nematocida minor]KAI5188872.1 hypothetical protein NEMIN01_0136 [Nematocida minor]